MHGRVLTADGVPVGEDDEVWAIGYGFSGPMDAEMAFCGKIRGFTNSRVNVFVQGDGEYTVCFEHLFKNRKNLALKQRDMIQESIDLSVTETKRLRKSLSQIEKLMK